VNENGPIVDLNDLRFERMLKAACLEPSLELEDLVLHALACFREVVGKEGIMFTKDDIIGVS
jgi:hypothetical protein